MKCLATFLLILMLQLSASAQTTAHQFKFARKTFAFELPEDFQVDIHNYIEGYYKIFYRLDTLGQNPITRLTFHYGSMVRLPHISDSLLNIDQKAPFQRAGKQPDSRYWREINLPFEVNIFYINASYEEKVLFDKIIDTFLHEFYDQSLTNTINYDQQNLYTYCVNVLLDSLSQKVDAAYILQGNPALKVYAKHLIAPAYNAEHERIYNRKYHLRREYEKLIGKTLIRLLLKPVYLEDARVKLPIYIAKTIYHSRNMHESEIFADGDWTFVFILNKDSNAFELEAIEKGIIL